MTDFIKNDYVQLAVIVSGLLTLILLSVQAFRNIIVPFGSVLQNGFKKSREKSKAASLLEIDECANNHGFLLLSIYVRLMFLLNSLVTLILAQSVVILGSFTYVPGYRENSSELLLFDMTPKSGNLVGLFMLIGASLFFLSTFVSSMSFALKVRRKIRTKKNQVD